jgi:hypothetical protein
VRVCLFSFDYFPVVFKGHNVSPVRVPSLNSIALTNSLSKEKGESNNRFTAHQQINHTMLMVYFQ